MKTADEHREAIRTARNLDNAIAERQELVGLVNAFCPEFRTDRLTRAQLFAILYTQPSATARSKYGMLAGEEFETIEDATAARDEFLAASNGN